MDSEEGQVPAGEPPVGEPRRQLKAPARWPFAAAVLFALAALGAWWMLREKEQPPPPAPVEAAKPAEPAPAPAAPPLPPVEDADRQVREALSGISPHPELKRWLETSDLARRFAAAVAAIAVGDSPRQALAFLEPKEKFAVVQRKKKTYADPRNYERYDTVAAVIGSIDAGIAGQAFQKIKPLLDSAYGEIGRPGTTLEGMLGRAVGRLTEAPVLPKEVELVADPVVYRYADAALEARSAAEKHLMRMGPKNQRVIQAKLRELATAAGVAVVTADAQVP